jgi:FKBP-type peptidyl-prolyl cis-trans isomerase
LVAFKDEGDEVGAAAHRAVLGEGLARASARILDEIVVLAAERARVRHHAILRGIIDAGSEPPEGDHMPDEQVIETATGLGYVEIVEGTGARPKTGDTVSVHYTGWLKSGQKFDSSVDRGEPLTFPIGKGRVIKGWDEGVASMKVGGKRKLIIPAHLGYGDRGAGGVIPPGATLIFEVELLGVRSA